MPESAFLELQRSVVSRLQAVLSPIPVYDHVPQDETPQFAVVLDDVGSIEDSKTRNGVSHAVTVDLYSGARGLREVKIMADAVYAELHRKPLAIAGGEATAPLFEFSEFFIEPDGARGSLRFSVSTY